MDNIDISLRSKIKCYKKLAREIENYLAVRPEEWGKFQNEFNLKVNDIFREIMNFEKENISEGREYKVKKLKRIFVNRLRDIFVRGVYIKWSLEKPLGYAGDYKIIDYIYCNNPTTTGFDRLFDNYYQMSAISIAVRNRKEDFKRLIKKFIKENRNGSPLRIMSLASGPCRDLWELFSLDRSLMEEEVIFDCVDNDVRAINFAKKLLFEFSEKIHFLKRSATRLGVARDIETKINDRYDMIYATGLFDYFSLRLATRVVHNLKRLLKQDGCLAISNVRDKYSNPSVHFMEWVGDWKLVYRDEERFKKIFTNAGFKEEQLNLLYEQQGIMQYVIAHNR